jgi:hypothetical protein
MPGLDGHVALCATAAGGMRQAGGFGGPERWRFGWDRPYARDEWLDQVPTFGGHGQLPPAALQEVLAGVGTAIDTMGGQLHNASRHSGGRRGANQAGGLGAVMAAHRAVNAGVTTTRDTGRTRGQARRRSGTLPSWANGDDWWWPAWSSPCSSAR